MNDVDIIVGPVGRAELVPPPPTWPGSCMYACRWLLTVPGAHPFYSQYLMMILKTEPIPPYAAPLQDFDGATHTLAITCTDPRLVLTGATAGSSGLITPALVRLQFEATDDEMVLVGQLMAQGVTLGEMMPVWPDLANLAASWLASITVTLACLRGEPHMCGGCGEIHDHTGGGA